MVKVTGGRGMKAIAAHFRYISKNGRLEIEDQRGETMRGKDTLRDLADEWRFGGSLIPDDAEPGHRREAFNIMLSMPRGTDPLTVQWAAREFAQAELADHKYVVHISVRAESRLGRRLQPAQDRSLTLARRPLRRKLRERGIEAGSDAIVGNPRRRTTVPGTMAVKAGEGSRLQSSPTLKHGASAQARSPGALAAVRSLRPRLPPPAASDPAACALDRDLASQACSGKTYRPLSGAGGPSRNESLGACRGSAEYCGFVQLWRISQRHAKPRAAPLP